MQKTLMAHALKRIAFATCFPDQRQFSFIAREPKSSTDDQFCHAFRARSAHEVWLIVSPHHRRHHDYSILWRGGVGSSPGRSASRNDSRQVVHTRNVSLFTKQYKLVPTVGWEGNHRSGVALAMRHRHSYGLNGLGKGDEHHT